MSKLHRSMIYSYKFMFIVFLCFMLIQFIAILMWTESRRGVGPLKGSKIKTILLWNSFFHFDSYEFGFGMEPFFQKECPEPFCYVTNDRKLKDMERFDAVVFHGPEFHPDDEIPAIRAAHQRYVYFSMESPSNRPVTPSLDDFFNWTMTYRLDSDITWFYFTFQDRNNKVISPSYNPDWIKHEMNESKINALLDSFKNKKRPIAWFVSNCNSKNGRELMVNQLEELISVDVYGKCGTLECPKNNTAVCFDKLKNNYYFYLSMENSNCDDYVTEKVENAMSNNVIPIVYGGADWTKFLPPDSYIDFTEYSIEVLAQKLTYLMNNPEEYVKYFWWQDWYTIKPPRHSFCKLCEMLHDSGQTRKSVKLFNWWHGEDNPTCIDQY